MTRKFANPQKSLEILDALEASGFGDEAFAIIHHHKEPMSIEAHRRYCSMLIEEGDEFKTINNRHVQQRLEIVLTMYRSAGFSSGKGSIFVHLSQAALEEIPHDLRSRAEQFSTLGEHERDEASQETPSK